MKQSVSLPGGGPCESPDVAVLALDLTLGLCVSAARPSRSMTKTEQAPLPRPFIVGEGNGRNDRAPAFFNEFCRPPGEGQRSLVWLWNCGFAK